MAIFNTNSIKEHFTNYLLNSDDEIKEKLSFCYFPNPTKITLDETDLESVKVFAEECHLKNDPLTVADFIFKEFTSPKRWLRAAKEKCTFNDLDTINLTKDNAQYILDVCGEINKNVIFNLNQSDTLIIRTFSLKNALLRDNYRLEFITLADDSDFVYWTIIVD